MSLAWRPWHSFPPAAAAGAADLPPHTHASSFCPTPSLWLGPPGDESLPYFPPDRHPDAYSRTKALAEQAVLGADGTPLAGRPGRSLRTCALRAAGIYGPGEQRHLPRMCVHLCGVAAVGWASGVGL